MGGLRIEDVSSLPGREVVDQEGEEVGEIKEVYGLGDDGDPMWVAIETHTGGMGGEDKLRFVPLARLREEDQNLSVPYSVGHVQRSPEVEVEDEISEEDDQKLRIYYSIGLADQEFRTEPRSYAAQVPEGEGQPKKVTDELDSKDSGESGSDDSGEESRGSEDRESEEGGSEEGGSEEGESEEGESEEGRSEEGGSEEGESEEGESEDS
jgi:sporulation protein YlmC with PRC-barrel domain